jgi:DNA primase
MAKTYVNTVKYQITIDFTIDGIVDKHDIIGAVFGQSEGLVGEEMDLRELQKAGKIGRIEVNAETKSGKSVGTVTLPSSMDKIQTSLLAAAIETVDKVGPCESTFQTVSVTDMRESKRKTIKDRAQEILARMAETETETSEMAEEVRLGLRSAELTSIGRERLAAGPDAKTADSVVLVEGRADVLALLKYGIKNVIGLDGSKIPKSIGNIVKGKEVTVFVDGDRGGELLIKNLEGVIQIHHVASAPDGKEVEELTQKEILSALRKKMEYTTGKPIRRVSSERSYERRTPFREGTRTPSRMGTRSAPSRTGTRPGYGSRTDSRPRYSDRDDSRSGYGSRPSPRTGDRPARSGSRFSDRESAPRSEGYSGARSFNSDRRHDIKPTVDPKEYAPFEPTMKEVEGKLTARLLNKKNEQVKEVSVRDLMAEMKKAKNVNAIVFDGIVTKRLVDAAVENKIATLVGVKRGKIEENEKVKVITLN